MCHCLKGSRFAGFFNLVAITACAFFSFDINRLIKILIKLMMTGTAIGLFAGVGRPDGLGHFMSVMEGFVKPKRRYGADIIRGLQMTQPALTGNRSAYFSKAVPVLMTSDTFFMIQFFVSVVIRIFDTIKFKDKCVFLFLVAFIAILIFQRFGMLVMEEPGIRHLFFICRSRQPDTDQIRPVVVPG